MDPYGPPPGSPDGFGSPAAASPTDADLGIPALDAPPRMDGAEAFAVGRALGNGIAALKRAPGPMMVAGFLMALLDGSNSGNFNMPGGGEQPPPRWEDDPYYSELVDAVGAPVRAAVTDLSGQDPFGPAASWLQVEPDVAALAALGVGVIVCVLVIVILFWIARSFIEPGVIRLHSHILQTAEQQTFNVIFSGSDRFVHMLLWDLLAGVIMLGALFVAFLPAILFAVAAGLGDTSVLVWPGLIVSIVLMLVALFYVGLGLSLGAHAVTLEERSPIDALKRSWRLAHGNRLALFIFFFVVALFQLAAVIVGILLCCIGLLATIPAARAVSDFATTEAFLMLTRGRDISDYWKLWELRAEGVV